MIADRLSQLNRYAPLHPRFPAAFAFVADLIAKHPEPGRYEMENCDIPGAVYANVLHFDTNVTDAPVAESHRKYVDVQILLSGNEAICVPAAGMEPEVGVPYDEAKDVAFYAPAPYDRFHLLRLTENSFALFFPGELHAPSIAPDGKPAPVRKVVLKVLA